MGRYYSYFTKQKPRLREVLGLPQVTQLAKGRAQLPSSKLGGCCSNTVSSGAPASLGYYAVPASLGYYAAQ